MHVQGSISLLLLFKTVNTLYIGSKSQIKLLQELQKNLFASYHITVILSTFQSYVIVMNYQMNT